MGGINIGFGFGYWLWPGVLVIKTKPFLSDFRLLASDLKHWPDPHNFSLPSQGIKQSK